MFHRCLTVLKSGRVANLLSSDLISNVLPENLLNSLVVIYLE